MNNKKKPSIFSYLFPYILLISIILTVLFIVNSSGSSVIKYAEGEIIAPGNDIQERAENSVLWKEDIRSISVTYYEGFVDISGEVLTKIGTSTKEGLYKFQARITDTETNKDILTYVFQNRTYEVKNNSGVVTNTVVYYGDFASFNIVNPYASNFWRDYFPIICFS